MGFFNSKKSDEPRARRAQNSNKSPAYSYYNNREQTSDAQDVRKKSGRLARVKDVLHSLPGYIAVIVIFGCIIFSLGLTTNPKVIVVNDQEQGVQPFLRTPEVYQTAVSGQLGTSVLNRSKLSIHTANVEAAIKQALPEVGEVSITLPIIGRNPVVYLKLTEPAFVLQPKNGEAFVVDDQGRAVLPASELPDAVALSRIDDKSDLPIEQGKSVLPADQIAFLYEIRAQFDARGVKISHFTLPSEANSLRVYPAKKPYYIKFSFSSDARVQAGRYLAAHKKIKPLMYVDVRVDNRIYVR